MGREIRTLLEMTPANLEFLAYESTPLGDLCLRRRRLLSRPDTVVTEITLDHELLMSSYITVSERALAVEALARHAGLYLSVLVGGLGLGYTAEAVLESERVGRLEVVEFLPQVVGFLRDGLIPLASTLSADPRLAVRDGDVYALLEGPAETCWDIVLIDVDHSPDEPLGGASSTFYSAAGLGRAKAHLAPGGILAVWSYAENSPFVDALRAAFTHVDTVPITYVNDLVEEENTDWLFVARDEVS
jgi:spermidine synthase